MLPHTVSPRSTPAQVKSSSMANRSIVDRAASFLKWLYGDLTGYAEIVAGYANPDRPEQIKLEMQARRWLYLDPERPDLYIIAGALVEQLAHSYGNVYSSYTLYDRRAKARNERNENYALPSNKIFIDDAPKAPDLPYSCVVYTSEGSRHGYYQCDRSTAKEDVRRVTAGLGGDPSGIDATQLVRVVGTFNTKNRQCFEVHGTFNHHVYHLDDLLARFPSLPNRHNKRSKPSATFDLQDIFDQERIKEIRAWLDKPRTALLKAVESDVSYITRIPTRVKPGTQTYDVLTNAEYRRDFKHQDPDKNESWDASLVRYIVCKGLILVGYDANHIAAFLDYLEDPETREIKGEANFNSDIQRLFRNNKLGTLYAEKQVERQKRRARKDRPQKFTPDTWYEWLCKHQHNRRVDLKRRERAEQAGISTATLDRLEDILRKSGRIHVETSADRSRSTVVLNDVINIVTASNEVAPSTSEHIPSSDAREMGLINIVTTSNEVAPSTSEYIPSSDISEVLSEVDEPSSVYPSPITQNQNDGVVHKKHTRPPSTECVEPVDLESAVHEAFESANSCRVLRPPDDMVVCKELATQVANDATFPEQPIELAEAVREAFGVLAPLARITKKRIQQYLARNYPNQSAAWSTQALGFWINEIRKQLDWQKQIDSLKTLEALKLKRLDQKISRILADGANGQEANAYPWACAMRGLVSAELERREPMEDRANPRRVRAKQQACIEAVECDRRKRPNTPSMWAGARLRVIQSSTSLGNTARCVPLQPV
ncbi:MAG: hypothetical protein AAGF95_35145, partial [Chloroflexota bacterium]